MPDDKIGFTCNEQKAMALLCQMMAKASYEGQRDGELDEKAVIDSVCQLVDSFPSMAWGDLYDRFHRQGVNR